jgi:NAD(P)-dependent dehydrogenase (short-subunit alcohol dehydrogenase family)
MGLGKRNLKMGVGKTKQQALLLVGASGGVGTALLKFLSARTSLVIIPTYNKNKPSISDFSWIQYDSNIFESTYNLFEEISKQYQISVVVDVSGSFFASKLQKSTPEEISTVISTNLVAPMILAKSAQEFMQINGKVIFMSSIMSTMQSIGSSIYASSKAGLERGILALSSEFSQTGHGICGIRLGYMDYGMTYNLNEKLRIDILKSLHEEKFIDISVLGEKILEICESKSSEINGILYEIK